MSKSIWDCQTPDELAEAIDYHLKQGGMRLGITNLDTSESKIEYDDYETRRLYEIALSQYNKIRKSYPKLPVPQIDPSDPLSALAQLQQLCDEKSVAIQENMGTKEEIKGIFKKIPYWIYILTLFLAALLTCLYYLGLLEPIKTFIYKILLHK